MRVPWWIVALLGIGAAAAGVSVASRQPPQRLTPKRAVRCACECASCLSGDVTSCYSCGGCVGQRWR